MKPKTVFSALLLSAALSTAAFAATAPSTTASTKPASSSSEQAKPAKAVKKHRLLHRHAAPASTKKAISKPN